MKNYKVDQAIIMAAGFGSRLVPLTYDTPKGLLKVHGQPMVERQIKQLKEVGIDDITIVVGYLKESFDYLCDKYGVKLLYNPDYASKNNLSTIYHALPLLIDKSSYILSSDNWIRENIFHPYEDRSWYCSVYMKGATSEWCLDYDENDKITAVSIGGHDSFVMYGPVFLSKDFSKKFCKYVAEYYNRADSDDFYWEQLLIDSLSGKISLDNIYINKQKDDVVYEFENLEELREFDHSYKTNSNNEAMAIIAKSFNIPESKIYDITCLKAGMTNKSFLFSVNGEKFICRIPGKGTEVLINRKTEYDSYQAIKELDICDEIIYFDADTGYKITKYYEGCQKPDFSNDADTLRCMKVINRLHNSSVKVGHDFDIRERIEYYEKICLERGDISFKDYFEVKPHMLQILDRLDSLNRKKHLCHIDCVFDNYLFIDETTTRLIDWEYAGMADPLIDIAMCSIYSYLEKDEIDRLLDIYIFSKSNPDADEANFNYKQNKADLSKAVDLTQRHIVYSYVALSGFLWALWTVYKSSFGETFGEYSLKMYRYSKDFYKILLDEGFFA